MRSDPTGSIAVSLKRTEHQPDVSQNCAIANHERVLLTQDLELVLLLYDDQYFSWPVVFDASTATYDTSLDCNTKLAGERVSCCAASCDVALSVHLPVLCGAWCAAAKNWKHGDVSDHS